MKTIKKQVDIMILIFLILISFSSCSKDTVEEDKSLRPDLYTYVPDNNFEQLLINQGYDDVLDNYITNSDVVNVTRLLFTSGFNGTISDPSGISDFTGIEAFVSLESFDCSSLNLSSINLNSNTALKSLNCSGNNFTSLDLSNLVALESLDCSYNNLTNLQFNSLNLGYLSCHENNLSKLDLTNTNSLVDLNCFGNNLTSIDISANINLTNLQVGNNLFETLDISQNVLLNYIVCHYNPLLTCVKVNENQLAKNWSFCSSELFSLSCD